MNFLKNNIFITIFLFYGCSSSNYKINLDKDGGAEVIGSPDRFLPYCEKVVKDDDTVAYGFMILFLDEKKTVGTATGMLTSHKACLKWENQVQKILDHGQSIVLAGFGNLTKPRAIQRFSHTFEKHGTFHDNGRSMDFFSIRNNRGSCFSVNPDRCE
jgi:hypothetical protein